MVKASFDGKALELEVMAAGREKNWLEHTMLSRFVAESQYRERPEARHARTVYFKTITSLRTVKKSLGAVKCAWLTDATVEGSRALFIITKPLELFRDQYREL